MGNSTFDVFLIRSKEFTNNAVITDSSVGFRVGEIVGLLCEIWKGKASLKIVKGNIVYDTIIKNVDLPLVPVLCIFSSIGEFTIIQNSDTSKLLNL